MAARAGSKKCSSSHFKIKKGDLKNVPPTQALDKPRMVKANIDWLRLFSGLRTLMHMSSAWYTLMVKASFGKSTSPSIRVKTHSASRLGTDAVLLL